MISGRSLEIKFFLRMLYTNKPPYLSLIKSLHRKINDLAKNCLGGSSYYYDALMSTIIAENDCLCYTLAM